RKSAKYKRHSDSKKSGLADYLSGESFDVSSITYSTNIDNLFYVPCGFFEENPTRVMCSPSMETFVNDVKGHYDIIILDFPSVNTVPDAKVVSNLVDGIVLICALGETRKRQLKDAKRIIAPFTDKYYGLVVNKVYMDQYKYFARDYDYYLTNEQGEQNLIHKEGYKKFVKRQQQKGQESENDKKTTP
ncbi:MAG: hypothetical protein K6F84_04110, partial [Lachnospiraceae bacterium]|nr:hypothetical protein [Lachnospiraceae bacterium]